MGRTVAVIWHASFSVAAGVLYYFFVLPRRLELVGETSHVLGTSLRIVTAVLIGLAALPVVFTLQRTRRPEFGTPRLALGLRTTAIALHVLAAALILGAAVSEIWLTLDSAGQWLFGIYGAAAAIALLGIGAFYLAFAAELPPPPPKPLPVRERRSRGRRGATVADDTDEADQTGTDAENTTADADEDVTEATEATEDAEATEKPTTAEATESSATDPDTTDPDAGDAKLRNRRPGGKTSLLGRRRGRGNVALDD